MGCDIHMHVEYRPKGAQKDEWWRSFGTGFNPGRSYTMFGILAGVRIDHPKSFEPKGIPENVSFSASDELYLFITDDGVDPGCTTLEKAKEWEQRGYKILKDKNGNPGYVEHPDWHSHSWMTVSEYAKALKIYKEDNGFGLNEYQAILAAMKALQKNGNEVRTIFWFDN